MSIRDESDNDRIVTRIRRTYQPVSSIAVERETSRERVSQFLVDRTLEEEQQEFSVNPPVQKVPGDFGAVDDIIGGVIVSDPQKMVNPVQTPPIERTTVSRRLKLKMGVANIRSATRGVIPPGRGGRIITKDRPAFGLFPEKRIVSDTPVSRLNWMDRFFNWFNAFLS